MALPVRSRLRALLLIALSVAIAAPLATVAQAHEEREVTQPEGDAFPEYRDTGPALVVCKPDSAERIAALPAPLRARNLALLERCEYEHIQPAVNAVAAEGVAGTRILVLPGVYHEEPSRQAREQLNGAPIGTPPDDPRVEECAPLREAWDSGEEVALSYEEQLRCPHVLNLIAVTGDTTPADESQACDGPLCDLQIEGTGARPQDVIIDGELKHFLNGILADRADGFYLRNVTGQRFEFNAFYVLETAGATIDSVIGSFNHEYGFLSFVSYVRYENCGGSHNGDSVVYPGASPDVNQQLGLISEHREEFVATTEVRGCRGHHSALGYSGTTGNGVWMHHNEWDHNATGTAQDSLFPGHPGTPQNHALIEDNLYHENNVNHYSWSTQQGENLCAKPLDERDYEDGTVCPAIPVPVGTGQLTAGGNFNWIHGNAIYDNWRQGTFQFWVPAELREGEPVPDAHDNTNCGPNGDQQCPFQETSHWNTYSGNRLADNAVQGAVQPNGADFAWDVEGEGNCWAQTGDEANTTAADAVTYRAVQDPSAPAPTFPDCASRDQFFSPVSSIATEGGCIEYDASSNPEPTGCDWFEVPAMPSGRQPEAATLERLAGTDRVDTAILASQEGYPTSAPTVVLARRDAYPDALAGAPLAHARGGPLLLTDGAGLDPRVSEEIERLRAVNVILLGGTGALSTALEDDLSALGFADDDIVRIAGRDRFETSVAIAEALAATDVFVAKGVGDDDSPGWVDALAVSSTAALLERPILLTPAGELHPAVETFLQSGSVQAADIVGGDAAVSPAVQTSLEELLGDVERVAGPDRFGTSLAIAQFALKAGADPTELWLTRADDWPDGIAAGSAAAVDEGFTLLVSDEIAGSTVASWLDEQHPFSANAENGETVSDVLERVRVLGGTAAVPASITEELASTYGVTEGDARGDRSHGTSTFLGRFAPLPGADASYGDVTGYAVMEKRLDGATRVRLYVAGLPTSEGTAHPVHVHSEPCATPAADNPHYAQDPAGPAAEPNEIHPGFSTGPGATGEGDSTVFHVPEDDTLSVMIHTPQGDKVLCADLA